MLEVKRRKTANHSTKPNGDQREKQLGFVRQTSGWMDLQMVSSLLSLLMCTGLIWFLFQQSAQLAAVEEKYHLLKQETIRFQDMENKMNIMFEELESSSGVLQETYSSISKMTKFEQEVPSLHNIMQEVENNKQIYSKRIQSINEKFQNEINHWKRSQTELDNSTSSLKSEVKRLHSKVTSQINTADQKLKSLSERLKDLEDSTVRNLRTVNRQEEDELTKVKELLQFDGKATEKLEEQQNSLLSRNTELSQKLADSEPKMEECKSHLPTIEKAVHSVVRLSRELIAVEKKMENMTIKVYHVEDEIRNAVSDITEIQKTLEGMEHETNRLQFQNEVLFLEEKSQCVSTTHSRRKQP
ncbi:inhibitor of nuclear factor kappa-B kinase-interacting protein isoform X3 [Anolis carolinensis]|uniref:IKBKB interacting protein n=2 Tax=Anolis carolinensis TaxID=28377 RepID=G1KNE6_ANOCA|nr:PREDICTED: inhibitor of nuclear factor kappa-B kinase-interacting protein isoform X1 [Anolis carolinensis]XP_008109035.1 PREDICTED: inhibitor of nuclear factor kappa-B kinase-interacting protein isoform X1 [Anolis carolinensis]XP_008109036.1 PREDICTED: inhibitor of nuclear factor kappa-B kinase-interacting protein isoform X1 [Anolis carolinensis]|eukprot:XP_008109034.1 PREDICTED: inhibitor of nuclear factor kappa-B kinase-interacting protein isoform X1 [Anolis carolinensis]